MLTIALSSFRAAQPMLGRAVRRYANCGVSNYHARADDALESLLAAFEDLAEIEPEVDAELAQGVLTIAMPPAGTYVLNKQPTNKQIWLSSPISGPRRYETASVDGPWQCCRDGSTLGSLLRTEVHDTFQRELELDLE